MHQQFWRPKSSLQRSTIHFNDASDLLNHFAINGSIQVQYFTVKRDGKMFIIHYLVMSPPAAQQNTIIQLIICSHSSSRQQTHWQRVSKRMRKKENALQLVYWQQLRNFAKLVCSVTFFISSYSFMLFASVLCRLEIKATWWIIFPGSSIKCI